MGCFRQKAIRITLLLSIFVVVFFCTALHSYAGEPTATGTVCEGGVNVRSNYSTDAGIVTTLGEASIVTVVKEKHTSSTSTAETSRWFYIQKGSAKGWVRADCLSVSYSPVSATTTGKVNVRKGPESTYASVALAPAGEEIKVRLKTESASGAAWYKVVYNGYVRYINASYLAFPEESITENTNFNNELAAFPASYHDALRKLHEKYPAWHFKARTMDYTWDAGLAEQMYSYKANTIPTSKPDGFKMVANGTYNFDTDAYIGLDGASWVAASKKAVAFYMDPRNWLDEINIFMFESLVYDPATQSEAMVKSLLSETAINQKFSSSYMKAGETYNISPVYLAAKSRLELGPYDYMVSGTKFTYNGKTYQGYYNAYNIGASDSASGDAAKKGLVFAASGSSYLRPWKTLDLAIRGGAMYIAEDFVGNQQHTLYYERFNVANGLPAIGTHQYMTNTMAAATQANITYWNYEENNLLNTAFTFEIPVYQNMPATKAKEPGKGNNNYFLDSLKVYEGSTRRYFTATFDRFTNTYTLKSQVGASELKVTAVPNASDATVTVTGNTALVSGANKIKIKVKAASGLVKYYYINVTKKDTVEPPVVTGQSDPVTGKPKITWEPGANADHYEVHMATMAEGPFTFLTGTTETSYVHTDAQPGQTYYYLIKSKGVEGVIGTADGNVVSAACTLPAPAPTVSNRAKDGKPQLSWAPVEGAVKYQIYRATAADGEYTRMWTQSGTTYTNTKADPGVCYYYKIKTVAAEGSHMDSALSNYVKRVCDLPRPVVKAGNRASDGKPQLTWEPVEGAAKYQIYRSTTKNGTYIRMWTQTGNTYTNTKAETGKMYYYKVKAISAVKSSANSAFSLYRSRTCDLPRPVVKIKLRDSDGKPQLTWDEIDGAKQYKVYRSKTKNGTYSRIFTTSRTSYTNTGAVSGTKYYYKVLAVSELKSSADSAYSAVKTITVE
ncbi:MAG: SH3 domain-containing protein [Firmicutes bacterium]|nr:SH3 domain-containing protein [Bacillota bacterium]